MSQPRLYLASQSPRRAELLRQIGVEFATVGVNVDESVQYGENPRDYVERLARAKAKAGWEQLQQQEIPVMGSDTAVVCGDVILGKPVDARDAKSMLRMLSGQRHTVLTAVALQTRQRCHTAVNSTQVWFRSLSDEVIDAYWASGEPRDKAGSYAIQGFAAVFVERIDGSYSGVMGLPLAETYQLLQSAENT